jgi:hypothetical protein
MTPSPATSGDTSYWDKYYYFPTGPGGERMGHNRHHESIMREEVRALFSLYGVQVMGVVSGRVHVTKKFIVPQTSRIATGYGARDKTIFAANDGPLDAPIEYWQQVCKTLLDYAVEHGYREKINEQEELRPDRSRRGEHHREPRWSGF